MEPEFAAAVETFLNSMVTPSRRPEPNLSRGYAPA
jgi:hypothetical protein